MQNENKWRKRVHVLLIADYEDKSILIRDMLTKNNKHKRTIVRSKFKKFKSIYSENIKYKLKYTI